YGIAIDRSDNLIIADSGNYRIRRLDPTTGIIKTIAGTGNSRYFGDNGPATAADFRFPFKLTIDSAGSIFVSDPIDQRIRKIDSNTGLITTAAGSGEA